MENFAGKVNQVYRNLDNYDLSIDKLDVSQGGVFTTFQDNKFYYKVTNTGAAYYLCPGGPVTPDMKLEIKKAGYTEQAMMTAFENNKDLLNSVFVGFASPYNLGLLYPWYDVISIFPPNMQIKDFQWYKNGLSALTKPAWISAPFTDLFNGWVMDIGMAISVAGKPIGVTEISMSLKKLVNKHLTGSSYALMMLGQDLSLLGITAKVKEILPVKVLEDIDYTRQMKDNTFIKDEFKLDHPDQSSLLRDLAQAIKKGLKVYQVKQGNKNYYFAISRVEETGFYVVGVMVK